MNLNLGVDDCEKPLNSMINTHSFRDEHEQRHISPNKFQVKLKYMTPSERVAKAQEDAEMLLSKKEPMSSRKPFIFRAHEPLKSNNKGFQ